MKIASIAGLSGEILWYASKSDDTSRKLLDISRCAHHLVGDAKF